MKHNVTVQINLAPSDYPLAKHILPHQLKMLANQANEIILTVDTKASKGRFSAGWKTNRDLLNRFLYDDIKRRFDVKIDFVDYSELTKKEIARYFFANDEIPNKDFRGGPYYSYFYGLFKSTSEFVFHLDSDIILGGGSSTWIAEACNILRQDNKCLFVAPLPGPPHPQGLLKGQKIIDKIEVHKYQLADMSTRIFMTDKTRMSKFKLKIKRPALRNVIKAIVEGNPPADLPEHVFCDLMKDFDFKRIDFLGSGKGLWSLHPPYKTANFYENLEFIIKKIEENSLPENQYGFYDIIDEVCDWSEARALLKTNRWWKRILHV